MPKAYAHIENLLLSYEKLCRKYEGSSLLINTCKPAEHGVQFDYVEGGTLEEALDDCLHRGDEEGFLALLSRYEKIAAYHDEEPVSDHDLIFANILIGGEKHAGQEAGQRGWKEKLTAPWTLIDYEWTFPETESGAKLTKRAMFIYVSGPEIRRRWLFEHGIAQRYGITPENLVRLQGEETAFQQHVTGGLSSMAQLYDKMGQPVTPVRNLVLADQALDPLRKFQVYVDMGEGFSEERSFFVPHVYEDRSRLSLRISFDHKVRALRLTLRLFRVCYMVCRSASMADVSTNKSRVHPVRIPDPAVRSR